MWWNVFVCNTFFSATELKSGGAGDRTRGLSHAKRTLYH